MDKVIPEYSDKFEVETIYAIDYNDLDEIIIQEYGIDRFECCLDQSNDSYLRFEIHGSFGDYEESRLRKFLGTESQDYNTVQLLLNDLCRKGKIYPGTYLINISW